MRRGGIGRCDTYGGDCTVIGGRIEGRRPGSGSGSWPGPGSGSGSWSPAVRCHPERQRRISVRVVSDAIGRNYQSAGRCGRGCAFLYSRRGLRPLAAEGRMASIGPNGPWCQGLWPLTRRGRKWEAGWCNCCCGPLSKRPPFFIVYMASHVV